MFYERLKEICRKKETSITKVLKQIGIGTANGTYWKNGSIPSSDIVIKLAKQLDVSTDYLLGLDEKPIQDGQALSDRNKKIFSILNDPDLTDEEIKEFFRYVDFLKSKRD